MWGIFFSSKELLDLQRFTHPIRSLSSSLMPGWSWWIGGELRRNALLQRSKRYIEAAFTFFSTTGFLPKPSACRLVDIYTEGKEQRLINSIRRRNRGRVWERRRQQDATDVWNGHRLRISVKTPADMLVKQTADHYSCNQGRKYLIYLFITCDDSQWTEQPSEPRNAKFFHSDVRARLCFNKHMAKVIKGSLL